LQIGQHDSLLKAILPVLYSGIDYLAIANHRAGPLSASKNFFRIFSIGCLNSAPFFVMEFVKANPAGRNTTQDRIQAELQRQLDAWLAENPDWNK
jgi:hypothetical protein